VRPLVGLMPGFMPARSSDAEDDEQPSQAGLLASGSKRAFVKPSHPVARVIGVTRGIWTVASSLRRENEALTSYSSATAPDLHRLPYSIRRPQRANGSPDGMIEQ
jgi:hypothetical protein